MSIPPTDSIRTLVTQDAASYRALRLRALRDHPGAFGASLEDWEQRTVEQVAQRLADSNRENFILGAFVEAQLAGTAALFRGGGKEHHRATVAGMYVAPEYRGLGLGRALLDEAVRRARMLDGLEIILLGVAAGNEPALRLYLSAGFEPHYIDWHALKIGDYYVDLQCMRLVLIDKE